MIEIQIIFRTSGPRTEKSWGKLKQDIDLASAIFKKKKGQTSVSIKKTLKAPSGDFKYYKQQVKCYEYDNFKPEVKE